MTLPPGKTVFVVSLTGTPETVPGIPVPVRTPRGSGKFTNLPEPRDGALLIVTPSVAEGVRALTDRTDVVVPGWRPEDVAKDAKGKIVACKTLLRL